MVGDLYRVKHTTHKGWKWTSLNHSSFMKWKSFDRDYVHSVASPFRYIPRMDLCKNLFWRVKRKSIQWAVLSKHLYFSYAYDTACHRSQQWILQFHYLFFCAIPTFLWSKKVGWKMEIKMDWLGIGLPTLTYCFIILLVIYHSVPITIIVI